MRVLLDTNVLASAIATRGICHDILHVTLAEHELVVGEAVLTELGRVLVRKFRLDADVAKETDAFLRREAEVVGKAPPLGFVLRDADDIAVLEQAIAGASDVLVSGDRDFLDFASKPPFEFSVPAASGTFYAKTTPPRISAF